MMNAEHGGDIYSYPAALDFSANINPLGPPPSVVEAAGKSIEKIHVYPDPQHRELCRKIAEWEKVSREQILVGNGAAELIYAIILAHKPRKAIVVTPGFSEYEKALDLVGCQIVEFPLYDHPECTEDESKHDHPECTGKESMQNGIAQESGESVFCWNDQMAKQMVDQVGKQIDKNSDKGSDRQRNCRIADRIVKEITPDLDMVVLVNPNNPTGYLFDQKVCRSIIEACQRNNVLLLVDECFMDFVVEKDQVHCMDLFSEMSIDSQENRKGPNNPCHIFKEDYEDNYKEEIWCDEQACSGIIVLKAFTKIFAIPGLRLGYAIFSQAKIADQVRKYLQPWNVSVIAEACGIAALQEAKTTDFLERSRQYVEKEKEVLRKALTDVGLEVYPSAANYLFFKADLDLYSLFLEKGILIRSCANYKGLGPGYFRIAVRRHEENEIFCKALGQIMDGRQL